MPIRYTPELTDRERQMSLKYNAKDASEWVRDPSQFRQEHMEMETGWDTRAGTALVTDPNTHGFYREYFDEPKTRDQWSQMRTLTKQSPFKTSNNKAKRLSRTRSAVSMSKASMSKSMGTGRPSSSHGKLLSRQGQDLKLSSSRPSTTGSINPKKTQNHFSFSTCSSAPRESGKRAASHKESETGWNDRFQVCVSHLGNQTLHDTQREYFDTPKQLDGWTPQRKVPVDIRTNARFSRSSKSKPSKDGSTRKKKQYHFYPTIGQKTSQDDDRAKRHFERVAAKSSKMPSWSSDKSTPVTSSAAVTGAPITNGSGLGQDGGLNTFTDFTVPHSTWHRGKVQHVPDSTTLKNSTLAPTLWNYSKPMHIYSSGFAQCAPLSGNSNQGLCK